MATGAGVPVGDVGGPHTPPTHALPVGHNDLTRERKISSLADIGPKDHAIERRALIPGPPAGGPHSPPADKMLQWWSAPRSTPTDWSCGFPWISAARMRGWNQWVWATRGRLQQLRLGQRCRASRQTGNHEDAHTHYSGKRFSHDACVAERI